MKKSILSIGTALNKAEQKLIFGGSGGIIDGAGPTYYSWYHAGQSSTGQPGGSGSGDGRDGPECATDNDCCHYQHNTGTGYVCSSGICAPGLSPHPFCGL